MKEMKEVMTMKFWPNFSKFKRGELEIVSVWARPNGRKKYKKLVEGKDYIKGKKEIALILKNKATPHKG